MPQNIVPPKPRKTSCFANKTAPTANTRPMTTKATCLIASPVESPCSTNAVIEEDEYTITKPRITKARVERPTIKRGAIICAGALLKNEFEGDLLRFWFVCSAREDMFYLGTSFLTSFSYKALKHFTTFFKTGKLIK